MPAYVIATMVVHDADTYRKYAAVTPAITRRHGGRYLTRGDEVATVEGEPFSGRLVLMEFPSRQHAENWLNDPDYVAASAHRRAASEGRIIIQEGCADMADPDPNLPS